MTETDLDLATEVERLKAQVDWNAARVDDLTERLEKSQAQIDEWAQISVIEGALADQLAEVLGNHACDDEMCQCQVVLTAHEEARREMPDGPASGDAESLKRHMEWLYPDPARPCICDHAWVAGGRLHGINMGKHWGRITTEPDCYHHGVSRSLRKEHK